MNCGTILGASLWTMSIPPSKRHKINDTSGLFKPFKSPVQKSQDENSSKAPSLNDSTSRPGISSKKSEVEETKPPLGGIEVRQPPKGTTILEPAVSQEVFALRRQHTVLLNNLSTVRAELDKVDQALKIEASPRDEELKRLIQRWRVASQQAAEEVYADARDRVNGMGGLHAWQEKQKKRSENGWGWDDSSGQQQEEDMEPEEIEEPEKPETEAPKEDEDGNFTMDMMLRTLNIELDVIGYDDTEHRWLE